MVTSSKQIPCDSHKAALVCVWLVFFYFQYGMNKDYAQEGG